MSQDPKSVPSEQRYSRRQMVLYNRVAAGVFDPSNTRTKEEAATRGTDLNAEAAPVKLDRIPQLG